MMLAEWRGLEYVLEILKVLHKANGARYDSKKIAELVKQNNKIEVNVSYLQKVLQRMSKSKLVTCNVDGYTNHQPINEIMVNQVLEFCTMPEPDSPLHAFCDQLKAAVSLSSIDEFYDFS
jgi:DNA-binding IscR family transcriptional regulator